MPPEHEILRAPLEVEHQNGGLMVLKQIGQGQENQGEAISLDTIVSSCDAEVVAKGTSAKGPNRGAILRHGSYVLWAYAGGVKAMTRSGRRLFINTVYFTVRQQGRAVLEQRRNMTRDGLLTYFAKPELLETARQYLPEELDQAPLEEVQAWLAENRPYLFVEGRRFQVDDFARALGIPNHRRAFLERCIAGLEDEALAGDALEALEFYTGQELGPSVEAWKDWYGENAEYLFFTDCDGFRFVVDEEAKALRVPFEKLRGWSSEELDYRSE